MLAAASSCQMLNASCQMSFSHSAQTVLALRHYILLQNPWIYLTNQLTFSSIDFLINTFSSINFIVNISQLLRLFVLFTFVELLAQVGSTHYLWIHLKLGKRGRGGLSSSGSTSSPFESAPFEIITNQKLSLMRLIHPYREVSLIVYSPKSANEVL